MTATPAAPAPGEPPAHASPVPVEARPYQGEPAGIVTRLVANTLDGVVVGLLLAAGYAGLCGFVLLLHPRSFTFPQPGIFFSLTAMFGVTFLYLTIFWTVTGRTYGDVVMGLRVLRRNGRALRLPGAALRAAFCVLFPIGVLWIPVGRHNRSVQDTVLATKVVYDWQPRSQARLWAQD
jgi:uncharacterized RDD family membrane protein YckC